MNGHDITVTTDGTGSVEITPIGVPELPTATINSIRTEVMEFQATFEDYLAATCDGTEPWEHAGELVPRDRLTALRGRA